MNRTRPGSQPWARDQGARRPAATLSPDAWMEGLAAGPAAEGPIAQPRPLPVPDSWTQGLASDAPEAAGSAAASPVHQRLLVDLVPDEDPEGPAPMQSASRRSRSRWALGLSAGGLALLVTLGAAVAVQAGSNDEDRPLVDAMSPMLTTPDAVTTAAPPSTAESPAAAPVHEGTSSAPCAESNGDRTWSGRRPGGTANGPDVIFGFQHLYYVERDAAKARALTTPDIYLAAVDKLQAGIDSVPQGTTYCLRISQTEPDLYRVVLTQFNPDRPADVWIQTVRTRTEGDRTLIASIQGEG